MAPRKFNVVISGGGPVGLITALLLADSGQKIALIDPAPLPTHITEEIDLRVSFLRPASLNLLHTLNIAPRRTASVREMQVHTGDATLSLPAALFFKETLGAIVETQALRVACIEKLKNHTNISVLTTALTEVRELDHTLTLLTTQGDRFETELLIVAEGVHAPTRDLLGISVAKHDEHQQALVATVHLEQAHQNIAWQRFSPNQIVALLPLADPHLASLVWSSEEAPENLNATLTEATEQRFGQITVNGKTQTYPLITRLAERFTLSRVALLGDAAHTLHPLAGLGLNLGLEDVVSLTHHLKYSVNLAEALHAYELARRYPIQKWQLAMSAYRHADLWLKPSILNFVNTHPFLKKWLAEQSIDL